MTSISNLESILINGLMSHRQLSDNSFQYTNVSNAQIQTRRENIFIQGDRSIHEYVPFYFTRRSPMLLNILNRKIADQFDMIYFAISLENVLGISGTVFSDRAVNSNKQPNYYSCPDDLKNLNWVSINNREWNPKDDEIRQTKMAEVLVPDKITIDQIDRIIVFNDDTQNHVKDTLNNHKIEKPIKVDNGSHYYTKIFGANRGMSLITGPKELLELCCNTIDEINSIKKRPNARSKDVSDLLRNIDSDFSFIPEMHEIKELESENEIHSETVGNHTLSVVRNLECDDLSDLYNSLTVDHKIILKLSAYFHDIGKGPKSRWPNGKQRPDEDHPADSLRMLKRILSEEVSCISEQSIALLCILVAYHDILGEIYAKPENFNRSENELINLKDKFGLGREIMTMLYILTASDIKSLNEDWYNTLARHKGEILI